jgi:hypothetical protein
MSWWATKPVPISKNPAATTKMVFSTAPDLGRVACVLVVETPPLVVALVVEVVDLLVPLWLCLFF